MSSKFKNKMKNWWFKHNYSVKDCLFAILVGCSFVISTNINHISWWGGLIGFFISYVFLEEYVRKSIKWRNRNGRIYS